MFEHPPWKDCPACAGKDKFGVLMVGGSRVQWRCKVCRHTENELLPLLDKAVIYFDQHVISELYKVGAGTRKADAPHEEFWTALHAQVKRLLMLQQAVFPDSDLHLHETTVFKDAAALRAEFRRINGEVRFDNTELVKRKQVWAFADAYSTTCTAPVLDISVDGILIRERNAWLPDLVIHVNPDYSGFADGLRADRAALDDGIRSFVDRWARDKPSFEEVLEKELTSYGLNHCLAYFKAMPGVQQAHATGDGTGLVAGLQAVVVEHNDLMQKFGHYGFSEKEARQLVMDFWNWPVLQQLPAHRISSYFYAAMARKVVSGQKGFSRGMMNDVTAISIYAPYVDAMFVDNECAALLGERPLSTDLVFKAKIFCLNSREQFLKHLAELEARTPADVRAWAEHLYGFNDPRHESERSHVE